MLALFSRQCLPTSLRAKVLPQPFHFSTTDIYSIARHNIFFEVNLSDLIDWHLYFDLYDGEREKILALVPAGSVVIDIGAHVGSHSLFFSKKVGALGSVHAFEPFLSTFKRLEKNCSLNLFSSNIKLNNAALSDKIEQVKMQILSEGNSGQNKIDEKGTLLVKTLLLDDYCDEQNIQKIDFIKIDVEGYELKALKGAEKSLLRYRPILFIELSDDRLREQKSSAADLLDYIERIGYNCFTVQGAPLRQIYSCYEHCHLNIFAIPKKT